MRIALLTDGITPFVTGGMQRHSFNLCRELVHLGVQVDLYHCDPQKKRAKHPDVFTAEERKLITEEVMEFPSLGSMPGHYLRESYEYSKRIFRRMNQRAQPDFIYAKGFTAWEFFFQREKGWTGPKIGVNFHGYEMFQRAPSLMERMKQSLLRSPVRYSVQRADAVFSYGGKVTDIIRSLGVPAPRIVELPGGVAEEWLTDKVSPVHPALRFVFVGRDERRKGLPELYQALRQLKGGEWEFHFIGEIGKKIAGSRYDYHGKISDTAKMKSLLQDMDVLVCPSISEGMPNVILEAMASGLAVLATDTGATSCLVTPENGWLIAPAELGTLSTHLQAIIATDRKIVQEKKNASLQSVRSNFLWKEIGTRTLSEIKRIAGE
jgi:glycosyltransferase involved in cell wall biosynthesis